MLIKSHLSKRKRKNFFFVFSTELKSKGLLVKTYEIVRLMIELTTRHHQLNQETHKLHSYKKNPKSGSEKISQFPGGFG